MDNNQENIYLQGDDNEVPNNTSFCIVCAFLAFAAVGLGAAIYFG